MDVVKKNLEKKKHVAASFMLGNRLNTSCCWLFSMKECDGSGAFAAHKKRESKDETYGLPLSLVQRELHEGKRKSMDSVERVSSCVKTFIRIRPKDDEGKKLDEDEQQDNLGVESIVSNPHSSLGIIVLNQKNNIKRFQVDRVFDDRSKELDLHTSSWLGKDILDQIWKGKWEIIT